MKKKKTHNFENPSDYKYKTYTIDTTNLPRSDDINFVFPYSKEINAFDFTTFDPSRNPEKLNGEEMLSISEEIEQKIGELYTLSYTKPTVHYIFTFILACLFAVLVIVLANSSGIQNKEIELFIKFAFLLFIFLAMVTIMAKIYTSSEKKMKLRHKKFKEFERKWNSRKKNVEKGIKIEFGDVGSWMRICLDEAEEKRRKTTRRSNHSTNQSFSGSNSSGRAMNKKFQLKKKFLNKLEIIDEEVSENIKFEKKLTKEKEEVDESGTQNKEGVSIGYLKSERGDPVTMRGLEDNDIIIDVTLSEIKQLQSSISSTIFQHNENFEYEGNRYHGLRPKTMSEHAGMDKTMSKEDENEKRNYESAGGIEEYKNKNMHLVLRSPSFSASSKNFEFMSGSENHKGNNADEENKARYRD